MKTLFEIWLITEKLYYSVIVAIVGPNGVGKSTFLKLLTGDLEPVSFPIMLNYISWIWKYGKYLLKPVHMQFITTFLWAKNKLPKIVPLLDVKLNVNHESN